MVIENYELAQKYQKEYENLWKKFEPAQVKTVSGSDPYLTKRRPTFHNPVQQKQKNPKYKSDWYK